MDKRDIQIECADHGLLLEVVDVREYVEGKVTIKVNSCSKCLEESEDYDD